MAKKKAKATLEVSATPTALAIPSGSVFGRLQSPMETLGEEAESFPSAPYMGFYSDRTNRDTADQLMDQVGAVQPGQVYIRDDDAFYLVDDWRVIILAEFKFFGRFDWSNKGRPVEAAAVESPGLSEAALVVTLHIPPQGSTESPILAVSRVLKAQTRFVRDMARAVTSAMTPQFLRRVARTAPEMAPVLQGTQDRFRVAGTLLAETVPTKSGHSCLVVSARAGAIQRHEFERVAAFMADPENEARLDELLDLFEMRKAEIVRLFQ